MREEIRNQTAHLELNSWKELHTFLKNSKLRYRVSLDEASMLHPVFLENFIVCATSILEVCKKS